jgi:DNA-binding transcriptional MerR regulator
MDQVLSILNTQLTTFITDPADRPMTASMINNYVKQRLLPPPEKKKYSREQVTRLVMIAILKQVLSIAQVAELLNLLDRQYNADAEQIYQVFCDSLEQQFAGLTGERSFEKSVASANEADDILHLALISFLSRFEAATRLTDRCRADTIVNP